MDGFALPTLQEANRASIALGSAGGDEMLPGAGVRGLLNPPPLRGVRLFEGSGFDGLAELELLEKTFSVSARYRQRSQEVSLLAVFTLETSSLASRGISIASPVAFSTSPGFLEGLFVLLPQALRRPSRPR